MILSFVCLCFFNSLNAPCSDYRELYEKAADKIEKLGSAYALDKAWLDACDKKAAQTQERLENELNSSRTALLKENIRVCCYPSFS